MKRGLSMFMIVVLVVAGTLGLSFGADTTETENATVSLIATITEGAATFDISEKVTVKAFLYSNIPEVSKLTVTNKTNDQIVKVESIRAEGMGAWTTKSSEEVDAAARDTKYINLSTNGTDLTTATGYAPSSETITGENAYKTFQLHGRIPAQTSTMGSTDVARLIVTISTSDITFNGFTLRYLKTVPWSTGSNAAVVAVIKAIDQGKISTSELTGWDVGAERKITISKMDADYNFTDTDGTNYTGSMESHAEQTATLVIMDVPGSDACATKTWKNGTTSKAASFIVGLKDCLAENGVMNATRTNSGSWKGSERRAWCNSTFYNAMLSAFDATESDNFFKKVTNVTGDYSADDTTNGGSNIETYDYFALPAEKEASNGRYCSTVNEYNDGYVIQFTWNATTENRIKNLGGSGDDVWWWTRSPTIDSDVRFCTVATNGWRSWGRADYTVDTGAGISPFGCL